MQEQQLSLYATVHYCTYIEQKRVTYSMVQYHTYCSTDELNSPPLRCATAVTSGVVWVFGQAPRSHPARRKRDGPASRQCRRRERERERNQSINQSINLSIIGLTVLLSFPVLLCVPTKEEEEEEEE